MSADPRIEAAAKAARQHDIDTDPLNDRTWYAPWDELSERTRVEYRDSSSAVIAAYLAAADKAATITTVEELDALPGGSAIVDAMGEVLTLGHGCFYSPGHSQPTSLSEVALPARVIHWGTE